MPSSDRILRRDPSAAAGPQGSGGVAVSGVTDVASASGTATVIQGDRRRSTSGGRRAGDWRPGDEGHGQGSPGERAASKMTLGVELQQARRIAEDQGYAAGRARGQAELRAAIGAATSLAARLEAIAPGETTAIAHTIAELALSIARRVVGAELSIDPAILVTALEAAVATINGSPEARVIVHPSTVGPLRAGWEANHGAAYLGKQWSFEGDSSMPPGGCILRYDHGFVDAGLETQLEEIGIALDASMPGLWAGQLASGPSIADLADLAGSAPLSGDVALIARSLA
jgi:flagellar assembly protein FliH